MLQLGRVDVKGFQRDFLIILKNFLGEMGAEGFLCLITKP